MRSLSVTAIVFSLLLLPLAACENAGRVAPATNPASAGVARKGALPLISHALYISNAPENPGGVFVYRLPITPSSQYFMTIGDLNAPGAIGFAPGRVYVLVAGSPEGEGTLVFEQRNRGPVSWVLQSPLLPEMLEVDKAGDVFQGQSYVNGSNASYQVNVFVHPITKNSKPAFTMNTAVHTKTSVLTRGMAFDRRGDLWIKDDDNQTMDEYVPPFSAKSVPKLTFPKGSGALYGSMIFDTKDRMFVTDRGVDVYRPPFTKKSTKAFTIAVPGPANSLAFDSVGQLYVAGTDGNLYVFTPPFSASSQPQVTLPIPTSPGVPFIGISP